MKRLRHLTGNWELSIDFRQWVIGFNFYPTDTKVFGMKAIFNLFLGPIRLGWWEGNKKLWGEIEE